MGRSHLKCAAALIEAREGGAGGAGDPSAGSVGVWYVATEC